MKRLDAIEARLKAATPGPWTARMDTTPSLITAGATGEWIASTWPGVSRQQHNAVLISHAPPDLALLVRLVRDVAASPCERLGPAGQSLCASWLEGDDPELWSEDPDLVCWPCRVRRKLAGEVSP